MIKRREFITLLGGAAAWPLAAPGQGSKIPRIGVLDSAAPTPFIYGAFVDGLREVGFVDRQSLRIEYRSARGAYQRLPGLAAELVGLPVDLLATFGTPAVRAAKVAAMQSNPAISVVFAMGSDPVAEGIVDTLHRPGGNVTGITSITGALAPKRLEFLRELVGADSLLAILVNPGNPVGEAERRGAESAAGALGQRLEVLTASNEGDIPRAFALLKQRQIRGLIIATDAFYYRQLQRMATLAAQHTTPAIGPLREFAAEGGLLSYGPSIPETTRQCAILVAKVLRGARPADLPVQQPTKFELVINLAAAKELGLEVPPTLLARADEVIE
jgi:putative tryptophan/tyrosine transport system substrate-binding protein